MLVYGSLMVKFHMHVYDYLTCIYVALWMSLSAYSITIVGDVTVKFTNTSGCMR
jgi:hypothetical protein